MRRKKSKFYLVMEQKHNLITRKMIKKDNTHKVKVNKNMRQADELVSIIEVILPEFSKIL